MPAASQADAWRRAPARSSAKRFVPSQVGGSAAPRCVELPCPSDGGACEVSAMRNMQSARSIATIETGCDGHAMGADMNTTMSPPFSDKLSIHDVARQLNSWLGTTLVAVLSGATDKAAPESWEDPHSVAPSQEFQERLWSAHRVWKQIATQRSEGEARLWFTGVNTILEQSPVLALRIGRMVEVEEAADAFLDGSWSL